ncbi:hypothetical protein [Amycolatopsis sp. NPDC098790]|uniref:hypothetical protein n=1 Tax=Amycolatopsis sp. NPDC098790 TaxID=3363939 RepID=UPI003830D4CC
MRATLGDGVAKMIFVTNGGRGGEFRGWGSVLGFAEPDVFPRLWQRPTRFADSARIPASLTVVQRPTPALAAGGWARREVGGVPEVQASAVGFA